MVCMAFFIFCPTLFSSYLANMPLIFNSLCYSRHNCSGEKREKGSKENKGTCWSKNNISESHWAAHWTVFKSTWSWTFPKYGWYFITVVLASKKESASWTVWVLELQNDTKHFKFKINTSPLQTLVESVQFMQIGSFFLRTYTVFLLCQ